MSFQINHVKDIKSQEVIKNICHSPKLIIRGVSLSLFYFRNYLFSVGIVWIQFQ